MSDDSERRTTQDETTPRFGGRRFDWERRGEELSRTERAELVSQREKEAEEMRQEVGAIPKSEPDPYCVPMNLQPDDPECQPRPVQQQRRGNHVVGGHGRHR